MLRLSTAAIAVALTPAALAVSINEIQPNPNGQDASTQQIELLGTAGASFSGVLLSIESDGPNGTVDRLSTINGTFDANGLLVVDINDLENPSNTLILLDSFSGSLGDDLDVDGDGMLDAAALSSFGTVYDAVGIADSLSDEDSLYASQVGGTNLAFSGDEPQLIFRDSVSLTWYAINDPAGTEAIDMFGNAVDFSLFNMDPSMSTFGDINPTLVPVPAAVWLFGSALLTLGWRRKSA